MKSKTLLFLSLLSLSVTAQNWQPINKGWHYNYRFNNANLVTNTILVDSAKAIGADSIFYLNRILLDCDTCHAANFGTQYNCDSCFVLGNQPQFLQRTIIKKQNGIYQFKDTGNIVLPTLAALNTTWLFDSLWNISATVTSINIETILGATDSVKTILLSSGDTIKFSKNFGITLYPYKYGRNKYHRLSGIEQLHIGEHVPNFWDFNNFSAGDIFYYHYDNYSYSGTVTPYQDHYDTKATFLYKQDTDSGFSYTVKVVTSGSSISYGGFPQVSFNPPYHYIDTITGFYFNGIGFEFENSYQNKRLSYPCYMTLPWEGGWYNASGYEQSFYYLDSNNVLTKSFGIKPTNYLNNFSNEYLSSNYFEMHEVLNYNNLYYSFEIYDALSPSQRNAIKIVKFGIGAVSGAGGGFSYQLMAYQIGSTTSGNIPTDDFLLGVENISSNTNFKVYPNPCKTCYINGIENPNDIMVFDILGKQINTSIDIKESTFTIQNLSSGIYFVRNLKSGEIIKFVTQ